MTMQYILDKKEYDALQEQIAQSDATASVLEQWYKESTEEADKLRLQVLKLKQDYSAIQDIADARLKTMNNLQREVQRLKSQHVCVVQNPRTDTIQVVKSENVDNYLKFGWIKLTCPNGDDEFIIH